MTIKRKVKDKCPACGTVNDLVIWNSINAQVNPKDRDALLNGKINLFTCSNYSEGLRSVMNINRKELVPLEIKNRR
jgi:tetrahydromethanopterin S-methyltransferase subunit H